jgi:thiol-disulfide isomerase/thioredoxin
MGSRGTEDLEGEDFDGHSIKTSDYRGKVVVTSFWAAWCGPCMAAVPHERELVMRMRGKPFALIGINGDSEKSDAIKAVKKEAMTWPSIWNGTNGPYGSLASAWSIKGWPTLYVLDPAGATRAKFTGMHEKELDAAVDLLVEEATRTQ